MLRSLLCISIIIVSLSCESEDDSDAGTASAAGSLQLGFKSVQSENSSASAGLLQTVADAPFKNYSNASGKPDELNLTVYRIALNPSQTAADRSSRPVFDAPDGKTLAINKSRIDLSDMFTNFECVDVNGVPFDLDDWYNNVFPTIDNTNEAGEPNEYRQWTSVEQASCECGFDKDNYPLGPDASGSCPPQEADSASSGQVASVDIAPNTYESVTIFYRRRAQVKGCVTGYFYETWNGSESVVERSQFCTQSALAGYDNTGGGTYSDFEDKTAEFTDISLSGIQQYEGSDLPGSGSDLDPNDVVRVEFPIPGGITIEEGSTAQLTLVIDTNRLLQFYSAYHSGITNNGTPRGAGPNALADKSYFYTSVFEDTQFFFVGQIGNIYGFEMVVLLCTDREPSEIANFSQASDYNCTTSDDDEQSLWMTVIEDANENILIANILPDDGLSKTTLKGDNMEVTSNSEGGFEYNWGQNWESNTDGTWNISYGLRSAEPDGTVSTSLQGTLYNVNKSSTIGAAIPNVYYMTQKTQQDGSTKVDYGLITMKRQL